MVEETSTPLELEVVQEHLLAKMVAAEEEVVQEVASSY
jgi:hypothetical protein